MKEGKEAVCPEQEGAGVSAEGPAGVLELTERGHGADERRTEDGSSHWAACAAVLRFTS